MNPGDGVPGSGRRESAALRPATTMPDHRGSPPAPGRGCDGSPRVERFAGGDEPGKTRAADDRVGQVRVDAPCVVCLPRHRGVDPANVGVTGVSAVRRVTADGAGAATRGREGCGHGDSLVSVRRIERVGRVTQSGRGRLSGYVCHRLRRGQLPGAAGAWSDVSKSGGIGCGGSGSRPKRSRTWSSAVPSRYGPEPSDQSASTATRVR